MDEGFWYVYQIIKAIMNSIIVLLAGIQILFLRLLPKICSSEKQLVRVKLESVKYDAIFSDRVCVDFYRISGVIISGLNS